MKIIHQNGFSDKERADYRHIIYKNLTESARSVVIALRKLGLVPEEPANRVRSPVPPALQRFLSSLTLCSGIQDNADKIMDYDVDLISATSTFCYPEDLALAIQRLWQDPVIPKLLDNHSSEFYLMDSAP
jgi:guanine nucleotide-binding protein G(i) subunit alpha